MIWNANFIVRFELKMHDSFQQGRLNFFQTFSTLKPFLHFSLNLDMLFNTPWLTSCDFISKLSFKSTYNMYKGFEQAYNFS